MPRRASRPAGSRTRRPGTNAASVDALHTLKALFAKRGSDAAEAALDRWVDALSESPETFSASAEYLAAESPDGFTREERWLLLSIAAEVVDDPVLGDACEELEGRMEVEAKNWPGSNDDTLDHEKLRSESPVYRALSEAWSGLRAAIEISFLHDIGMPEMARAMIDDAGNWERSLRDGEATLLGIPRIVLTADDDPFGILLP